jgi:outer membrane lipoprotein SlyB
MNKSAPTRSCLVSLLIGAATLGLVGCNTAPSYQVTPAEVSREGRVDSIRQLSVAKSPSGAGALAGGAVGGLLGSQVGGGNGQIAAAVIGALGGAYVGNRIEAGQSPDLVYEIVIRYDNGDLVTIHQPSPPPFRIGDRVRVTGNTIELLHHR